jgi:hypothetical protein
MTRLAVALALAALAPSLTPVTAAAAQLDQLLRGLPFGAGQALPGAGLSEAKVASGLKEALQVATARSVDLTGVVDGFFTNQAIKILMPESLRTVESGLRTVGLGSQVDAFVLSMNRAAERAAPAARQIFGEAVGEMTFDDAREILSGGDTAATEYFKAKSSGRLAEAFRPVVERSMGEVGVTRQYQELLGRVQGLPFVRTESLDLDRYVTGKALDGLFHVVGEQERLIRTDPAARATDLLKEVFGRR